MANNIQIQDIYNDCCKALNSSKSNSLVKELIQIFEGNVKNIQESIKKDTFDLKNEELIVENYYAGEIVKERQLAEVVKLPSFEERKAFFEKNIKILGVTCPIPETGVKIETEKQRLTDVSQIIKKIECIGKDAKKESLPIKDEYLGNIKRDETSFCRENVRNKENIKNLDKDRNEIINKQSNSKNKFLFESKIKKPTDFFNLSESYNLKLQQISYQRRPSFDYLDRFIAIDRKYCSDIKIDLDQEIKSERKIVDSRFSKISHKQEKKEIEFIPMKNIDNSKNLCKKSLDEVKYHLKPNKVKSSATFQDLNPRTYSYTEVQKVFEHKE